MARSKKQDIAPLEQGTSIATIDQQLASEVAMIKNAIGQPSGNKIKLLATGDFILPTGENIGKEMQVVIVDFLSRNTWYSTKYNANDITPPDCYAIGRDIAAMAPEADSPLMQASKCSECPKNQFGSGDNKTSKACKNTRELSVLVLDPNDPESLTAPNAPLYTLSVPPSSLQAFDSAIGGIVRALNGPPIKAIITVIGSNASSNPNMPATYAKMQFTDPVGNPHYGLHIARRAESETMLTRKPDFSAVKSRPTPRAAQRGARR